MKKEMSWGARQKYRRVLRSMTRNTQCCAHASEPQVFRQAWEALQEAQIEEPNKAEK